MLLICNRKRLSVLLLWFNIVFCYRAQAMDQAIIPPVEDVVWKLFFTHNRDLLPYEDEHSFAQTSRGSCSLIYAIQDQRKKCINSCMVQNNIKLHDNAQCIWHRSWRIFGFVDIIADQILPSHYQLRMFSCELDGHQSPVCKTVLWDNFKARLPHNPFPFFNKNKELCFHGFHKSIHANNDQLCNILLFKSVMEYTTSKRFVCELLVPRLQQEPLHISLVELVTFPILLKNILVSEKTTIDLDELQPFFQSKAYYIDSVELSDNYQQFQYFSGVGTNIRSFNDLSKTVRNILARKYKDQNIRAE